MEAMRMRLTGDWQKIGRLLPGICPDLWLAGLGDKLAVGRNI